MAITKNTTDQILRELDGQTLSLYIAVDPSDKENQATTPAWQIWLKNTLKNAEKSLDSKSQATWAKIKEQVESYLSGYTPSGRTLALFTNSDQQFVYELPFRLANRAHFGEPLITPLLWAIDEYEDYLVVRAHRNEVSFMHVYMGQGNTTGTMHIDLDYDWSERTLMPATSYGTEITQGSNREAYEDMIDAHTHRFFKDVADHVAELVKKTGAKRIILGGSEQSAHALKDNLPNELQDSIVDVIAIPYEESEYEVLKRIQPVSEDYERTYETALVEEVIGLAKASGGRGALGREAVLKALDFKQVQEIIVSWPIQDENLAETLPLLAHESGSSIELVHGEAAERLNKEGGIAAKLYYTITT